MSDPVEYSAERAITAEQFVDVLRRSGLAERRPVDEPETVAGMVANADLTVTAWRGGELVGVARSVTDFAYCLYLSDLAVDRAAQGLGVGRELMRLSRVHANDPAVCVLLSAPAAEGFYERAGCGRHERAFLLPALGGGSA